jgi:hypothetical protein
MKVITITAVQRRTRAFDLLPKLDAQNLRAQLRDARVVTGATRQDTRDTFAKVRAATHEEFRQLFKRRSDIVERHSRPQGDPFAAPVVKVEERSYLLLNSEAAIRDAVLARKLTQAPTNLAKVYETLHKGATKPVATAGRKSPAVLTAFRELPTPRQTARLSADKLIQLIGQLAHVVIKLGIPDDTGKPANYPSSCSAEEGTGFGGDAPSAASLAANPLGLRQTSAWPLKWFNTCVRDQGKRGTCSAFGTLAAVESAIAVKHNRWVNLSEQDLYKHQHLDWNPLSDGYGEGYAPPLSLLFQLLTGYVFPFERDWDYNPSWSRTDDAPSRTYANSCVNYAGEACSDTNHQAARLCWQVETKVVKEVVETVCSAVTSVPIIGSALSEWVCEPVTRWIEDTAWSQVCVFDTSIPGTSGFQVTGITVVWDPITAIDIATAKAHLALRIPLIFCFDVPNSFGVRHPVNGAGYVAFDPNERPPSGMGSHCAMITGYVDNQQLPRGVEAGPGGGYFIVKNSWGTGSGDLGYYYVPYAWVDKWGLYMCAITAISP